MEGLALMLAERNKAQAAAWEAMTDNLAAKYGSKKNKKSGAAAVPEHAGAGKKKGNKGH